MSRMRLVTVPDLTPDEWVDVVAGTELAAILPKSKGPIVLCLNGKYLLRADWPEIVETEDSIEWYVDQPQDREDTRTFLQIAAVVAAVVPGLQAYAPYLAAAAAAYNLLVPPITLQQAPEGQEVYNASLTGNQARLDQPIWRVCGIDKLNPPFAAQPYYEFDENGDQYYYGVLAIGYGPHDMLAEFIGKTPIGSFTDVIRHAYLPPGVLPTIAQTNVVTSREVQGMELMPGRYVGGFVVCRPGQTVAAIGWDIVAPQGLGKPPTTGEPDGLVLVQWQVEYLQINDAGAPLGDWTVLANDERNLNTNTVVRLSGKQALPFPMRCMARMARTNVENTISGARDGIQWAGLRGYLHETSPLEASVSHYEIVMRASQQLSAQSQTDFNILAHGKCRTWDPIGGWNCAIGDFDNYVATRNPAWWLADLLSDPVWGEGLPDSRIDLQTLYDLSLTWDARQDRFDYTFSSTTDAWSAGQLIASAGRARMFRRYGVRSLARDELAEIGVTAFTPRTCIGDMVMNETLPSSTDPDGIIVEYISNVTWDIATVECPCPGIVSIERPIYMRFEGIKGRFQAEREGLYHAADLALRSRTVTAKTEMQALTAAFMLPARWQPLIPGYGQTGDVAFWDPGTLVMGLTEQPDFSAGPTFLTLRRDDGSLTDPVEVFPGPTVWDVVLASVPDFELVLDDGLRERPVFLVGTLDAGDELVKVSLIKDGGKGKRGAQYFDIEAVVDDPRVHTADIHLLPGPGDIQDPVGLPGDAAGGGGGAIYVVSLNPVDGLARDAYAFSFTVSTPARATFEFRNDGRVYRDSLYYVPGFIAQMWMRFGVVDLAVAALYEIRFTFRPDYYPTFFFGAHPEAYGSINTAPQEGSALGVWLQLNATRSVTLRSDAGSGDELYLYSVVQVDIRKIGSAAVAATGIFVLGAQSGG